jgi:predicted PurR-regulated permease PerM
MEPEQFVGRRNIHDREVGRTRLRALKGGFLLPNEAGAVASIARPLWILAVCALVVVLRFGRDVLVPVMLAVLLALVLSGIVETLRRHRIPRGLSALVLLLVGTVAIGCAVDALCTPAQQWVQNAPRVLRTIEHRVRPARSVVLRLNDIANRASVLAGGAPQPRAAEAQAPAATLTTIDILTQTGSVLGAIVTVMVLTLLLLAGGPPTLAHMSASLNGNLPAVHALKVIGAIRVEVGRYYGTLALINAGLGFATGIAMWQLGMPNPVLWGAVAAGLNFVPYLGAAVTLTILTVVALVSFDSITHVALVAASFLTLATIEGQLIQPIFLGRRLHLNPIVVFIALWVGGWLWGIPGIVFALPVLVAVKVAAAHSSNGRLLARFLGPSDGSDDSSDGALVHVPVVLQARQGPDEAAPLTASVTS